MTGTDTPEIYPQYCFHLSPTINRWCHFRAADIAALSDHPGFRGQDLYFHGNHPIKWVRIAGVVVAIDEFETRRIYTVDDSSGATIECVVAKARPSQTGTAGEHQPTSATVEKTDQQKHQQSPSADGKIDIGHIIDVKGGIRLFREAKQINTEKIKHLRSTEQEVQFWQKVAQLRADVLRHPWVLDRRQLRRCRREAEGYDANRAKRHKKAEYATSNSAAAVVKADVRPCRENTLKPEAITSRAPPNPPVKPRPRITGLEKRVKQSARPLMVQGKYDALGL